MRIRPLIKKKKLDYGKLRPLFSLPKLGVMNSEQVSRRDRRSPRMSTVSTDVRQSFRERNSTPDSRRMSENAKISDNCTPCDELPPFNFDPKLVRDRSMAAKLLAGISGRSPRTSLRHNYTGSSYAINSSQNSLASRGSRPRSHSEEDQRQEGFYILHIIILYHIIPSIFPSLGFFFSSKVLIIEPGFRIEMFCSESKIAKTRIKFIFFSFAP